jgi:hypothetical protein
LILIWDNLAGHLSWSIVVWLFAHGVMPLYTPLSGSWPNTAEAVQRSPSGRALAGQHPKTAAQVNTWMEDTVAGWNAAPTPFVWDGEHAADAVDSETPERTFAVHDQPLQSASLIRPRGMELEGADIQDAVRVCVHRARPTRVGPRNVIANPTAAWI